jgi:imidazolonepropionase-like amidohydrolase
MVDCHALKSIASDRQTGSSVTIMSVRKILLLCLLAFGSVSLVQGAGTNVFAFIHATVIDATGGPVQPDATVVIANERIVAVGKSAELHPPTNATFVDATGKFLIPGLWDMHVHWYDQDYLPLFIANGVTGIRIMWGMPVHHEWRKEIEQGTLLGPRLLIASAIIDGPKPFWPGSIGVANAAEAQRAVQEERKNGADFIKVYSSLPRDAYFAIVREAEKEGIPFVGHVPTSISVKEASEAGQKSIEHLDGILSACSSREADLRAMGQENLATNLASDKSIVNPNPRQQRTLLMLQTFSQTKAEALFLEFKTNHTWQCPTLTVLHNIQFLHDPALTNDSRLKYMPGELKSIWNPDTGADARFANMTPEDFALGKKVFQKDLELVGAMQHAGVDILAGTDTGNPYCLPGFGLHDELDLLVKGGLTPMEALQAATRNPARFMGREKDLGTIEPGKLADLVLLDENPLSDIANTRKIASVVYGGKLFTRAALDDMLTRVEKLPGTSRASIAAVLFKTLRDKNVEAAIQQYHELKSSAADRYDFSEPELNYLGYQLMSLKRIKEAIQILKLNAEAFPESANVYDSLGEAYLNDGDKQLAAENYAKSLQLDPDNHGAMEKLKQLRAQ